MDRKTSVYGRAPRRGEPSEREGHIDVPGLYDAEDEEDATVKLPVGQTIAALLDKDFLSRMMRYETSLQGRLSFTLSQLHDLRARRLAEKSADKTSGSS